MHRNTAENCKSKIIELFFGDNRSNCTKCNTPEFIDKASFFLASFILKRYGITIPEPVTGTPKKDYKAILNEVSEWAPTWIEFVDKHQKDVNIKGLIEKLYYYK
jgi:hypothetical protein